MRKPIDLNDNEDDFEMIEADLPLRFIAPSDTLTDSPSISLDIQSISAHGDVLISIKPPRQPSGGLKHVPCDIVLVVDVSCSMNCAAPLPDQAGNAEQESTGLSILDLVKHAARTILEKLNDNDRLAVVTFSSNSKIVQPLISMTQNTKEETWKRIEELEVQDCTNLWAGIKDGLKVFETSGNIGNVQGMFILTDGVPNHMCPTQGYVKKLQPMLQKMKEESESSPILSTFGFGYHLRSSLLRSIAEVGRGHYAFIPDAGMIGTVFVHAVANLFSAFSIDTKLSIQCSNPKAKLVLPAYLEFDLEARDRDTKVLHIANFQYGQSRDIIVKVENSSRGDRVTAAVRASVRDQGEQAAQAWCNLDTKHPVPQTMINYHLSRHELCNFLSSMSSKNYNNEYLPLSADNATSKLPELETLVARIKARLSAVAETIPQADTFDLEALLSDLQSSDPNDPHSTGQIVLALNTESSPSNSSGFTGLPNSRHVPPPSPSSPYRSMKPSYYTRWGIHYLPSILHAHMRQICTTFKDPGPLRYGTNSPLFQKMREELDEAFEALPAPQPSLRGPRTEICGRAFVGHGTGGGGGGVKNVNMRRYHQVGNPCFAGKCLVKMASEEDNMMGGDGMKIEDVRVGDFVWTPRGGRMIRAIVKTDVGRGGSRQELCVLAGNDGQELVITPWHPIFWERKWVFPADVCPGSIGTKSISEEGCIYSVMLEKDEDPEAHVIEVSGVLAVTLGHGMTSRETLQDARAHPFFGDYELVAANLGRLRMDQCGRRIGGGIVKGGEDEMGLACKFVTFEEVREIAAGMFEHPALKAA